MGLGPAAMEDKASLSGDEPKRGATGMDAYLESRFGPIEGVAVVERAQIVDDRGKVAHMLRCDDAVFEAFHDVPDERTAPDIDHRLRP